MDRELFDLAGRAGQALKARGWMLVTAESCTGGWVSECVTMVPGSSEWFERGFVTYTNVAKREMLGVQAQTLDTHGAVSEQTVREMVAGALARSHGHIASRCPVWPDPPAARPEAGRDGLLRVGDARRRADRRDAPASAATARRCGGSR